MNGKRCCLSLDFCRIERWGVLPVPSSWAAQKTGEYSDGKPRGLLALSAGRRCWSDLWGSHKHPPCRTLGFLGNSVPRAGSVCPGGWHLGGEEGGAAPGSRLIGLGICGQCLREAGKGSREHSDSFPLPSLLEIWATVGGVGSLGQT